MKKTKTSRGFALIEFEDRYGINCSLQESSLAEERCVWFGVNNEAANPRYLKRGEGWKPFPLPEEVLINTRMHLTQQQVKKLLPHLIRFAETGDI